MGHLQGLFRDNSLLCVLVECIFAVPYNHECGNIFAGGCACVPLVLEIRCLSLFYDALISEVNDREDIGKVCTQVVVVAEGLRVAVVGGAACVEDNANLGMRCNDGAKIEQAVGRFFALVVR